MAPGNALHEYVGVAVAIGPLGESGTGAVGAEGEGGAEALTVIASGALQGVVEEGVVAFANQLYVAPGESAVDGVNEQVVPVAHPAEDALTDWLTATPAVFCTRR